MKKILLSLAVLALVAVAGYAGTRAFFSDTEASVGNTFTAGAIDLKVDSTQHYNGMVCTLDDTDQGSTWQPEPNYTPVAGQYPVTGTVCDGTWLATDLGAQKFFNFGDIKPGDSGENTISLHVDSNDAYACVDVNVKDNDDNGLTGPESGAGDSTGGVGEGELAQNVYFTAWADDGNNIWDSGEQLLFTNQSGPASDVLGGKSYTLADSISGPLVGGQTSYIGLAWCAGTQTVDTVNHTISCDGAGMGNDTQTDSFKADIAFRVEQARNNPNFTCASPVQEEDQWTNNGTRNDGDVSFVEESGRGTVLRLTTADDTASRVRWENMNLNMDLSTFTGVSYDSKQVSASDSTNGNASMRLFVDLDGNTGTTGDVKEITSEPYYNIAAYNSLNDASIVTGTWQNWATTLADGKFWENGGLLGSTPSGGAYATNITLQQILTAYSSAKIVGISLGMGTYNKNQVVLVDNLIVNGSPLSLEN